eukprot:12427723-Karenia_brevis.AAC.1
MALRPSSRLTRISELYGFCHVANLSSTSFFRSPPGRVLPGAMWSCVEMRMLSTGVGSMVWVAVTM